MAKYYIEVSKYDKKSGEFKEPKIIKEIHGKIFENLFEIDAFTASLRDKDELFNIIRKENEDIDEEYNSAIIKSSRQVKYIILYDEKDIVEFANSCDLKDIMKYDVKQSRTYFTKSYVVKTELESFKKIENLVLEILNSNDTSRIREISEYSCRENDLVFLMTRCMCSSYDDGIAKENDINLIMNELKRYKTVRLIYVNKQKRNPSPLKSNQIARKKEELLKLRNKVVRQNKPKEIKTIEQNEEEFALRFEKENGMSWEKYNTIMHNIAVDDKEEFLDEEEVRKAYF